MPLAKTCSLASPLLAFLFHGNNNSAAFGNDDDDEEEEADEADERRTQRLRTMPQVDVSKPLALE